MPSTNGNNYYASGITPLSRCCNKNLNGEVIKIRRQPKLLKKDHFAPEELLMAQRQPSPIDSLSENTDITNVLTSTRIIKSILANSAPLSMSDLAGLLVYVQPMISSNYIESQDVAITFLGLINDSYWGEIVKSCEMPVNNSMEITEKNRIKNAQKARDLLVNVAMNVTKATISSSKSRRNLRYYTRTFKKH
uniref:Uncharacterized protein n=1 Tax=Strongyloides papillosus TaxID=174720 RepID=A0A0N5CBS3_STREA